MLLLLTNNKETIQRVWCFDWVCDIDDQSAIWAVAAVCPQLTNVYSECELKAVFEEVCAALPPHAKIDFPNIDVCPRPALSADDLRQADECFNTPEVIDQGDYMF